MPAAFALAATAATATGGRWLTMLLGRTGLSLLLALRLRALVLSPLSLLMGLLALLCLLALLLLGLLALAVLGLLALLVGLLTALLLLRLLALLTLGVLPLLVRPLALLLRLLLGFLAALLLLRPLLLLTLGVLPLLVRRLALSPRLLLDLLMLPIGALTALLFALLDLLALGLTLALRLDALSQMALVPLRLLPALPLAGPLPVDLEALALGLLLAVPRLAAPLILVHTEARHLGPVGLLTPLPRALGAPRGLALEAPKLAVLVSLAPGAPLAVIARRPQPGIGCTDHLRRALHPDLLRHPDARRAPPGGAQVVAADVVPSRQRRHLVDDVDRQVTPPSVEHRHEHAAIAVAIAVVIVPDEVRIVLAGLVIIVAVTVVPGLGVHHPIILGHPRQRLDVAVVETVVRRGVVDGALQAIRPLGPGIAPRGFQVVDPCRLGVGQRFGRRQFRQRRGLRDIHTAAAIVAGRERQRDGAGGGEAGFQSDAGHGAPHLSI